MNVQELLLHAAQLAQSGKSDAAIKHYKRILKAKPNHGLAHRDLGRLLLSLGENDRAKRHLEKAIKLIPQDAEALESWGDLMSTLKQFEQALATYAKVREIVGRSTQVVLKEADALRRSGQWQGAVKNFQEVLGNEPDNLFAHIGLGDIFRDAGQPGMALRWYSTASAKEPAHTLATQRMQRLVSKAIQRWHFPMMNDDPRNAAFQKAIEACVKPGDVVLDIGTGSGLLAMMAARAGAKMVYACDDNQMIVDATRSVIQKNGYADRITVIPKRSTALKVGVDLPERVDVLVCEIFDAGVFGEDALNTIRHAHDELLKPGARLVPDGVRVWAAPVRSQQLANAFQVGEVCGFDLSPFNRLKDARLLQTDLGRVDYEELAEPFVALELSLDDTVALSGGHTVELKACVDGRCDGFIFWYELLQDDAVFMSTSARQAGTHWRQAYLPIWEGSHPLKQDHVYRVNTRFERYILWFELSNTTP
jgi:precorrin-6B methylase 2/thioredoxin-like negative regulator of GroEL